MTAPHDLLARLRAESGTAQMAYYAEALTGRSESPPFGELPLIASAYMLGRTDALEADATECNGSARPMALRVLITRGLLWDEDRKADRDDVPF